MHAIIRKRLPLALLLSGTAFGTLAAGSAAGAQDDPLNRYAVTNLVSDLPGIAQAVDPNLVNPWGIAAFPTAAFWINDNGTGLSTLYDGAGHVIPATFKVPPPNGLAGPSTPTGIVANPVPGGFLVPGTKVPSAFIFATEDGTISAWGPGLASNPLNAVLAADNSKAPLGAVYKGLEFGTTEAGGFLYATNFRAGSIDVFDTNFAAASSKLTGRFADPALPPGYAPFGIRNLDGNLYVTYAKQDAAKHDDEAGPGHGFVDVFDTNGNLLQRLASGGTLNSPWGIARAPEGFGRMSSFILIGNFGDGRIAGYDTDGRPKGLIRNDYGQPVRIDGLWGLSFGGAAAAGTRTLYFTAGPQHEQHGLFGEITAR